MATCPRDTRTRVVCQVGRTVAHLHAGRNRWACRITGRAAFPKTLVAFGNKVFLSPRNRKEKAQLAPKFVEGIILVMVQKTLAHIVGTMAEGCSKIRVIKPMHEGEERDALLFLSVRGQPCEGRCRTGLCRGVTEAVEPSGEIPDVPCDTSRRPSGSTQSTRSEGPLKCNGTT
eukprot:2021775-Amphidinium_carterae.3